MVTSMSASCFVLKTSNYIELFCLGVGVVVSRVEGAVVEGGPGPGPGPVETSGYISEDADNMDQSDSKNSLNELPWLL